MTMDLVLSPRANSTTAASNILQFAVHFAVRMIWELYYPPKILALQLLCHLNKRMLSLLHVIFFLSTLHGICACCNSFLV